MQIDPAYTPAPIEHKDVFGITFEQGRNEVKIDEDMLRNLVTDNTDLPESAKRDLLIALIALKYTQSNSVCYAKDGQVIGVGAGQQSRIHCTRLAGNKADVWYLRQHPKVLALPFRSDIRRPDRDNTKKNNILSGDTNTINKDHFQFRRSDNISALIKYHCFLRELFTVCSILLF